MCGIAGIVHQSIKDNKDYQDKLKKMTDEIIHRGPDSEGHEFFENCLLGFRRLAILDTSTDGNQPMYSNNRNRCIVFNGEIYNYKKFKENLNYQFKNSTDTEVLLAIFDKPSIEKVKQLDGMFAFALWNNESNELFCARDRFGQKPFFYAIGKNGEFIFGSEIKSILSTGLVSKEINNKALMHYLKYSHLHPEQSIYKAIKVLPPASCLILKNKKINIIRYWNADEISRNDIDENTAINKIKELAEKAVERQLNSDVPVGAFLSGGYDSGTIVALASNYHTNLNTIAFGYDNHLNELPLANEIAQKYKTNHTEVTTSLDDLGNIIEEVYSKLDEPIADSSIPASYLINKEARKRMTVVLSGNAGDELFGGYNWYNREFSILNKKNSINNQLILKILNIISKKIGLKHLNHQLTNQLVTSKYNSIIDYHKENVQLSFKDNELKSLINTNENFEYEFPFILDENDLNTCLKMDLHRTLSGEYLVKDDRISMLNSIEIRIPFLDNDLVEYVLNLNYKYKVDETQKKKIFKKAFGDLLTTNILNKSKQGFGAPIQHWLKMDQLELLTKEILKNKNSKIYDYINFHQAQKYLNYDFKHWNLLILGIWMRKHF